MELLPRKALRAETPRTQTVVPDFRCRAGTQLYVMQGKTSARQQKAHVAMA